MTYTIETSTVRTSAPERQLITIEFAPQVDPNETEYNYSQPNFVFGEKVTRITGTLPAPLTVCGMELVESKTNSGQLLNQPYWKYLLNDGQQKKWLAESALKRYTDISRTEEDLQPRVLPNTCAQCRHFNDYSDRDRGWCNLFEQATKTHHQRTNDCNLFADEDPLNVPHARFAIDSKVKVIDATEHHSEWATFVIIGRQYNHELYRNTESYLTETAWYYWLINPNYESTYAEHLWVAETDICLSNEAHLICTEDIF